MRVLLIEDDSATAQSIELMLQSEGFNVYKTDLGEEGVDLGKIYDYDIILLDLNLPDMSGYEVLKMLRVSKVQTPILILSGLAGIEDKVRGLGFGADDYMTKPFHKDELVARIHAIVRRSKGHAQSVIQTGGLKVNLDTKTVDVNGQRVHLTGKEYQMLELLSLRKGTTLTKEMFLNHLYGGMDEPELKIIDVFICKLRKKLAATGKRHDPERNEIEQELDLVLGQGHGRALPRNLMLAGSLDEIAGHSLGIAEVDLGPGRTAGAKGKAGELQLGRGLRGALTDEVHGRLAHGLVRLLAKQLQAVGDGRYGIDHVVADAA